MGLYIMHILKHASGRCSFRQSIPEALRPFCGGKREHKVSIGHEGSPGFHSRYEAAAREYAGLIARAVRQREGAFDPLDNPRIAYLAERFRSESLEADDEARFSSAERELFLAVQADLQGREIGNSNWAGAPVRRWAEKARDTTEGMLAVYRDLRAIGDLNGIVELWEDEALLLIEASDMVVDAQDTEGMRRLSRALNDAAIDVCQNKLRRLDGDAVPTPQSLSLPRPRRTSPKLPPRFPCELSTKATRRLKALRLAYVTNGASTSNA